jgi:hypothetical protein
MLFFLAALAALVGFQAACSKTPKADPAEARKVLDAFIQAEREHRASHGGYWRGRPGTVDRDEAVKVLGIDLGEARGFEFTIEPADSGMDPTLRITARATGDPSVVVTCVQEATAAKPDCK